MPEPAADSHLLLDASVLVELVVEGEHEDAARRLLRRLATERDLTVVTAAHGLVEAVSVLRRLVRREVLSAADGAAASGTYGTA